MSLTTMCLCFLLRSTHEGVPEVLLGRKNSRMAESGDHRTIEQA